MHETEAAYVLENLHGANLYFDFLHEALRCLNSAAILASTVIPSLVCYASNVAVRSMNSLPHLRRCGGEYNSLLCWLCQRPLEPTRDILLMNWSTWPCKSTTRLAYAACWHIAWSGQLHAAALQCDNDATMTHWGPAQSP